MEPKFELTLINPQHVHALPGRKTDQKDCERIAELLQYGLLKGSFIPPPPVRELRDLTRRRMHLQGERNRVLNRIRRLLETVNVKLGSVVSDIGGKTARLMLRQLSRGNYVVEELVKIAKASLKNKKVELTASLKGFYTGHFRWLLAESLRESDAAGPRPGPHRQTAGPTTAAAFRSHPAPVHDSGSGVHHSHRYPCRDWLRDDALSGPGAPGKLGRTVARATTKRQPVSEASSYAKRLVDNAEEGRFLTALFWRISARGGRKKAGLAVAHRMLTIVWHIIGEGRIYQELGGNHHDRLRPERSARRLIRRLEQIGFDVDVKWKATPAQPPSPEVTVPNLAPSTKQRRKANAVEPQTLTSAPPSDPAECRRCARWGIACIHARNAKRRPSVTEHHSESVT